MPFKKPQAGWNLEKSYALAKPYTVYIYLAELTDKLLWYTNVLPYLREGSTGNLRTITFTCVYETNIGARICYNSRGQVKLLPCSSNNVR